MIWKNQFFCKKDVKHADYSRVNALYCMFTLKISESGTQERIKEGPPRGGYLDSFRRWDPLYDIFDCMKEYNAFAL